jgi:hypothetical protein
VAGKVGGSLQSPKTNHIDVIVPSLIFFVSEGDFYQPFVLQIIELPDHSLKWLQLAGRGSRSVLSPDGGFLVNCAGDIHTVPCSLTLTNLM